IWSLAVSNDQASCAFNEPLRLELRGPLDMDALANALDRVVQRHDSLRIVFSPDGRQLCIRQNADVGLQIRDFSTLDSESAAQKLAGLEFQEANQPFNLAHGPLFRSQLVKVAEAHHVLLFTIHHIICDGWSTGILLGEFAEFYKQACGETGAVVPAAASFGDYAAWCARDRKSVV